MSIMGSKIYLITSILLLLAYAHKSALEFPVLLPYPAKNITKQLAINSIHNRNNRLKNAKILVRYF